MSRMAIFPHIDRSFFFLFVSKCILRSISANCFLPNGTDVNLQTQEKNSYQPCNATAEFSMCCKLNAVDNASCHDGLCLSHDTLALWRGPCTDRTWQSSSCLKLCTTGTDSQGQLQSDYSERLTICPDDGSFCCGKENKDCCAKHQGLWIRNGEISNVNPSTDSSSTASSTAFSTSTLSLISSPTNPTSGSSTSPAQSGSTSSTSPAQSDSTSSTSPALSESTSSSNNIGAIVGGVVGGIVGMTLSAAVAWFISRRRSLSRLQLSTPSVNVFSSTERKSPKPREISGRERPHEMDGRDFVEIGD